MDSDDEGTEHQTTLEDFRCGLEAEGGSRNLDDYEYAGGDTGAKREYFRVRYCDRRPHPYHRKACVCTHRIEENCYIEEKRTGTALFTVGNHCIKRFTHGVDRTCTFCGTTHKNRKDNLCAECRKTHVFINVAFSQKDDAKRQGARWNPTVQCACGGCTPATRTPSPSSAGSFS